MSRVIPAVIATLLAGALGAASAGAASPRVVAGWPRSVGGGTVLPGPAGGIVVVSIGDTTGVNEIPYVTAALRRDGRRLWTDRRVPDCGNCDDGPQPEALQPDGTYGPIGVEGDDFWAIDRRGREVLGCSGAVAADGTCFFARSDVLTGVPSIVARNPAGAIAWSVDDPAYRWTPEFSVPPIVVRDAAGRIYTAFGPGTDAATGVAQGGRLIAVDPATHAILWGRAGPGQVLTALGSGVLAARGQGIVAFGPDGAERWSRPVPAVGGGVAPSTTVYDAARGRVYVGRSGSGVTALVATTGAQVWRTRPSDRARLLSVGRGGRVYLAIDPPGRRAVRAVRLTDGRTVWQRRTSLPVRGALELADGTVAVSAGNLFAPTTADRLTRLDPR